MVPLPQYIHIWPSHYYWQSQKGFSTNNRIHRIFQDRVGTSKSISIKYHRYPGSRHSSLLNSRHPMCCNDSVTRVELIGLWLQNSKDEILGEGRIWKVCQLHSRCNLWQWPCSRGCCLHTTNSKSNNFGNIILAFTHKFKILSISKLPY